MDDATHATGAIARDTWYHALLTTILHKRCVVSFCPVSPTTDDAAITAIATRTFQQELASLARRINPDAVIARASLSLFVEASTALFMISIRIL
jgi:hypothetical protein